ncbi:hypothetical protein HAX54_050700, partial [Datura stramonium]|nr:hypothetical protein [Datura stramonium]
LGHLTTNSAISHQFHHCAVIVRLLLTPTKSPSDYSRAATSYTPISSSASLQAEVKVPPKKYQPAKSPSPSPTFIPATIGRKTTRPILVSLFSGRNHGAN